MAELPTGGARTPPRGSRRPIAAAGTRGFGSARPGRGAHAVARARLTSAGAIAIRVEEDAGACLRW